MHRSIYRYGALTYSDARHKEEFSDLIATPEPQARACVSQGFAHQRRLHLALSSSFAWIGKSGVSRGTQYIFT